MARTIFGKRSPFTPSDHLFVACLLAAKANHFLVTVAQPMNYTYEDACRASNELQSYQAVGRVSGAVLDRALYLLAESTGYSLTDLGA